MELWIRSQNKEHLSIIKSICYSKRNEYYIIMGSSETTFDILLGKYPTKERCLEIIDEIQKLLMGNGVIIFKDIDIGDLKKEDLFPFKHLAWFSSPTLNQTDSTVTVNQLNTVVYEMPQE